MRILHTLSSLHVQAYVSFVRNCTSILAVLLNQFSFFNFFSFLAGYGHDWGAESEDLSRILTHLSEHDLRSSPDRGAATCCERARIKLLLRPSLHPLCPVEPLCQLQRYLCQLRLSFSRPIWKEFFSGCVKVWKSLMSRVFNSDACLYVESSVCILNANIVLTHGVLLNGVLHFL